MIFLPLTRTFPNLWIRRISPFLPLPKVGLPPRRGHPAGDAQRLKEMGDEISRRFSSPIARISGQKKSLTLKLDKAQPVNHSIIQENIRNGERIRQYKVEARVNGKWQTICEGESVGHKRIEQFPTVEASALRLSISQSVAQPDIRNFSVFNVQEVNK